MDKHAQKLAQDVLDMGSRYLEGKIGLEEFQLFLEGSFSAMEGLDITTKKFLRETVAKLEEIRFMFSSNEQKSQVEWLLMKVRSLFALE